MRLLQSNKMKEREYKKEHIAYARSSYWQMSFLKAFTLK